MHDGACNVCKLCNLRTLDVMSEMAAQPVQKKAMCRTEAATFFHNNIWGADAVRYGLQGLIIYYNNIWGCLSLVSTATRHLST
jgi:hypothetical protein